MAFWEAIRRRLSSSKQSREDVRMIQTLITSHGPSPTPTTIMDKGNWHAWTIAFLVALSFVT